MVRTKADSSGVKVSAAKAPRKISSTSSGSSNSSPCRLSSSKDKYSGGNSYNPQPIPKWQKGISTFFKPEEPSSSVNNETSTSNNLDNESTAEQSISKANNLDNESTAEQSTSKEPLSKNGIISEDDDDD